VLTSQRGWHGWLLAPLEKQDDSAAAAVAAAAAHPGASLWAGCEGLLLRLLLRACLAHCLAQRPGGWRELDEALKGLRRLAAARRLGPGAGRRRRRGRRRRAGGAGGHGGGL
jgi:hypothetical protein